jgi:hypothetical protein
MELYLSIIALLSILVLVLGYTTFNLLKKNEKQEDIVVGYLEYLDKLSKIIEASHVKLKDIDDRGVFEKDDEVGIIFSSILEVQKILNEFIITTQDAEEKK